MAKKKSRLLPERLPSCQTWLDEHPGYLKTYRENNPDYVKQNRETQRVRDRGKKICLDIQAQLKEHLPEITDQTWSLPNLDIQDEISLKPLEIAFLFSTFPCLDIQSRWTVLFILEKMAAS